MINYTLVHVTLTIAPRSNWLSASQTVILDKHTYVHIYEKRTVIRRGLFALGKNNRDFSHLDQRNGMKCYGQKISHI